MWDTFDQYAEVQYDQFEVGTREVGGLRNCRGLPEMDGTCCSSDNRCDVGGGDCDSDTDCADGLVCYDDRENCHIDFPENAHYPEYADCCVKPDVCNVWPGDKDKSGITGLIFSRFLSFEIY